MRDCPALGKRICPACCESKRQTEFHCPAGCEILEGSLNARLPPEGLPDGEDDFFDVKASRIGSEAEKAAVLYHIRTGKCPFRNGECSAEACPRGGMEHCPIHGGDAAG